MTIVENFKIWDKIKGGENRKQGDEFKTLVKDVKNKYDKSEICVMNANDLSGSVKGCKALIIKGNAEAISFNNLTDREFLETIIIQDGVKRIEKYGFSGCANLKYVHLPKTIERIDNLAFVCCSSLKEIVCNSEKELSIGEFAFGECKSLETVSISGLKCEIGTNCFKGCSNLQQVYFNGSIAIGAGAFKYCMSLKELACDGKNLLIRKGAFEDCKGLEKVTINSEECRIWENGFSGCSNLQYAYFPNKLGYIGKSAFRKCSSLKEFVCDDSGDIWIAEDAFYNCKNLEKISINNAGSSCFLKDNAFGLCWKLKSITIKGRAWMSKNVFYGCSDLQNLEIGNLKDVFEYSRSLPCFEKYVYSSYEKAKKESQNRELGTSIEVKSGARARIEELRKEIGFER